MSLLKKNKTKIIRTITSSSELVFDWVRGMECVKASLEGTILLSCGGGRGEGRRGRGAQVYFCSCNGIVTSIPSNKGFISNLF